MTYALPPLDQAVQRALRTWVASARALAIEAELLEEFLEITPATPLEPRHGRKARHLRPIPVVVGGAAAGWAALRRHAAAAAFSAAGASAAAAVTLTAVTAPVYRAPYDLDTIRHPAAAEPAPVIRHVRHITRIERRVRLIPAGVPVLPVVGATVTPTPAPTVTVPVTLPPVLPTPAPSPSPSQNGQGQNCDGILILGLCVL